MPQLETNIIAVVSGAINTVDDEFPGGGDATPGLVPGQLGKVFATDAASPWDTSIGLALLGKVRYVKFLLTSTLASELGNIAYWSDKANNVVTADVPAGSGTSEVAGVFLGVITKGNHGNIKVSGQCEANFAAALAKNANGVVGDVAVSGAANGEFDILTAADVMTFGTAATMFGRIVGICEEIVVDNTGGLKRIDLRYLGDRS